MSDLLMAINLLVKIFDKYAGKEGDKHSLNKAELKELLKNELGPLLKNAPDKEAVDAVFQQLDSNKDNSVDFKEFGHLLCSLILCCHEHFC